MANKPLKSIKFPGLPDTYTIPQVDPTLTQSGQAADAYETGLIRDNLSTLDTECLKRRTITNTGTSYSVWATNDVNLSEEDDYYIILLGTSGVNVSTRPYAKVACGYSTGEDTTTGIYEIGKFVKINIDSSRTYTKTSIEFNRSDSAPSTAITSSWEYAIFKGEPNRVKIEDLAMALSNVNNITVYEASGYFSVSGNVNNASSETKEVYTNKIPVKSGDVVEFSIKYTTSRAMWVAYCAWDSGGNFINRPVLINEVTASKSVTVTIPDNVANIAFTYRTYGEADVTIKYLSSLFDRIYDSEKPISNNAFLINRVIKTSDFNLLFLANHSYVATGTGSWQSGGNLITEHPVTAGQVVNVGFEKMDIFGTQPIDIIFFDENDGVISDSTVGIESFCDDNTSGLNKKGTKTFSIVAPTDTAKAKIYFRIITNVGSLAPVVGETYTITGAFIYVGTLTPSANMRNLLKGEPIFDWDKIVKGVNHRGFNTEAPENTLPAYRLSKKKGFSYVETDVEWTSDGVAVLLHDSTINRTARNADGSTISSPINIYDITYEQALTYDFGVWKSENYAGTKIPTFEQFIGLCKNLSLHPYIEIKITTGATQARIEALVDTVKKYGMQGKITWISTGMTALTYVKNYDNTARLGLVVGELSAEDITQVQSLKTSINEVFVDFLSASDELINACASENVPAEIWTVNTQSGIESLNTYITGVTSDNLIAGEVLYDVTIKNI